MYLIFLGELDKKGNYLQVWDLYASWILDLILSNTR
jgi:hypothetical protein